MYCRTVSGVRWRRHVADGSTPGVGFSIRDADDEEGQSAGGSAPTQREKLIQAVLGVDVSFWQDADGVAYATVPATDSIGQQRYRIRSHRFELVIRDLYGRANPQTIGKC